MNNIRILIVGFGSIGKKHCLNIQAMFACVDIMILRSSKASCFEDIPFSQTCEIEQAIDFSPDFAILSNPCVFHVSIGMQLASAGIHLLIEKPLSHSSEEVVRLMSCVKDNDVKAMVGYNLRFQKSLICFRDVVLNERFGRVFSVSAEVGQYLPDWRDSDYKSSVSAQLSLGGGALLELSHEIDYLLWLFGDVESVFGSVSKLSDMEIDVEDIAVAQLVFKNFPSIVSTLHLDFLQKKPTRICKVVCDGGTIIWDGIEDSVFFYSKDTKELVFQGEKNISLTYQSEVQHFVHSIYNDDEVPVTLEDGFCVIKVIEAIKKSSKLKRVVSL